MTVAKYARRPKQVNIAELKTCLQNEIRSLQQADFAALISNYEQFHSVKVGKISEVSAGMMFVGLLHLASER